MKLKHIMAPIVVSLVGLPGFAQEKAAWSDNVKVSGDLRLRHEYIDQDGRDERHRWRYRARIKADAKVNDTVSARIQLASGENDPVSTNETLDNGFSSKGIVIDQAFVNWKPADLGGLSFTGGKISNPMVLGKDLVWDGDLNPEGLNLNYARDLSETVSLDLNAGGYWIDERSSASDSMLYGFTAATVVKGGGADITLAGGYFLYENIKGEKLFTFGGDEGDSFGNSTIKELDAEGEVTSETYANDYALVEGYLEIAFDAGLPVKLYADYVVNTDADEDDTGYQFGVTLGKTKNAGDISLDYNWRSLEKDAVFGGFTDSDFIGGGTDGEGHRIQAVYQVDKNWQAGATLFVNTIGLEGDGTDYTRVQLDVAARF